jgi:uncharacterized protein (DUF1697 family)
MTAIVCLLRGVNVGGHNKIKMDELRGLCESLGLRDPQTYVQSGNVVFAASERNLARLAARIESALEQKFGFRSSVVLRTAAELRDVIARNPFAARRDIDPRKLLVTFLATDPGAEARAAVLRLECHPEELHATGRELYIYFPNGMGRPKLKWPHVDKALKTAWTGRNWNTVTELLEMAEKLEACD